MRSLLPLGLYCVSLVCLQRPLASARDESPGGNRPDLLNKLFDLRDNKAPGLSETAFPSSASRPPLRRVTADLGRLAWARPASAASRRRRKTAPSPAWALPADGAEVRRRPPRARRHTSSRGGHYSHGPQLMRVGCVLGTCQVQNLSHRLYQLIGQSGKEDSSPINPRSPHSFG